MNKQNPGQASSLNWRQICSDIQLKLDQPDPAGFAELRQQGAMLLRSFMQSDPDWQQLRLELHLIDLQAALSLCSPLEALNAWQQLQELCALPAAGPAISQQVARCRYIAAVLMLQAGLSRDLAIDLPVLREELPLQSGVDRQLVQALLQDALFSADKSLAIRACCLASSHGQMPTDHFELRFRQLSLSLLENRAMPEQLADLLGAAQSYAHWQLLTGPIWHLCLEAGIIPLDNWKLHLEAHERCHDWIYQEIARSGN